MSDFDYKDAFGYDFSQMPEAERAKADAWLNVASAAMAPDAYPGAANAKRMIEMKGGLSAETARKLAAYSAYKAKIAPMSTEELAAAKIPITEHEPYRKRWIDDHASQFNALVKVDKDKAVKSDKEERAIEMQPEMVTAKAPDVSPPPAAEAKPARPEGAPAMPTTSTPAMPQQATEQVLPAVPSTPVGPNNWTRKQLNHATGEYEAF